MVAVQSFEAALCFLSCAFARLREIHEITAFFLDIRSGSHDKRKCKRKQTRVNYTTQKQTQAQAPTQGMENFSFPCAYVCISHV